MKNVLILFLLCIVPIMVCADITGTKHDFSSNTWGVTECGGCHKPHNAGSLIPLWNDGNSFDDTLSGTVTYSSPTGTLDGTQTNGVTGISEACMACHDGMVDFDATADINAGDANRNINQYLDYSKSNHPVNITYQDDLDTGLNDPADFTNNTVRLFAADGSKSNITGSKVECSSCHTPHDDSNGAFLLTSKATLCQECHAK